MSSSYDSFDEEFDLQEEENITMILAIHVNKKPKHGDSVFGCQKLWRERNDTHNRLMSIELFKHIAEKIARHNQFFQQMSNVAGELGHSERTRMSPRGGVNRRLKLFLV